MKVQDLINNYRKHRNFDVRKYVDLKCKAINNFFQDNSLDSAVFGISGGIDSAVVLALLHEASKIEGSPIKKILPISMPINHVIGVTGQDEAENKAHLVMKSFGYESYTVYLNAAYNDIIHSSMGVHNDNRAWAEGQMASVLRTPVLYYHAAMLQANGYKSLVVGTTNRDEGCYIGFFGKASDAMVDLQPIADIHKSEVYQVAEYLNVPSEIIKATPKGDVWDNKVDEEMIGAPYDFLEMYTSYFLNNSIWFRPGMLRYLDEEPEERKLFDKYAANIEEIHNKNAHKYKVGNPAHFIDVMNNRGVPGGWK
jgi:NAD+ synthetase